MKLNYDSVRSVLLMLEKEIRIDDDMRTVGVEVETLFGLLPQYSSQDVLYTVEKLKEAGYITAVLQTAGGCFIGGSVSAITYEGHRFIETVRDSGIWHGVKNILGKAGAVTIPLITGLAQTLIEKKIEQFI